MRVGAPPREGGARVGERARKRAHHPPAQGQKHAKVTVSRGGDAKAKQAQSSSTHAPQRAGWHGTGAPSRITGARCAERGETRDNHHAGSERGDAWPQRMCARGQELSRRYRRKCMASHLGVGRRAWGVECRAGSLGAGRGGTSQKPPHTNGDGAWVLRVAYALRWYGRHENAVCSHLTHAHTHTTGVFWGAIAESKARRARWCVRGVRVVTSQRRGRSSESPKHHARQRLGDGAWVLRVAGTDGTKMPSVHI
jgi:hypothetical protein